jgi:hypothetical protein
VKIIGHFPRDEKEFELLICYPVVQLHNLDNSNHHVLSYFPKFNGEVLDLYGFSFSGWNQSTFPNLKILHFNNCINLKELPTMSQVKSLKLLGCTSLTIIPPFTSLEELEVDRCSALAHISLFPGLKDVSILPQFCWCHNFVDIICSGNLTSFHLSYCYRITIDKIAALLQTPSLTFCGCHLSR